MSRNRYTRAFHATLAASSRPMTSPPLRLGADTWSEAKRQATTLLHMIRAAHRCSQGFSEYGLPPELRHLEPEMPAFAARCLQTILTAGEGDHN